MPSPRRLALKEGSFEGTGPQRAMTLEDGVSAGGVGPGCSTARAKVEGHHLLPNPGASVVAARLTFGCGSRRGVEALAITAVLDEYGAARGSGWYGRAPPSEIYGSVEGWRASTLWPASQPFRNPKVNRESPYHGA